MSCGERLYPACSALAASHMSRMHACSWPSPSPRILDTRTASGSIAATCTAPARADSVPGAPRNTPRAPSTGPVCAGGAGCCTRLAAASNSSSSRSALLKTSVQGLVGNAALSSDLCFGVGGSNVLDICFGVVAMFGPALDVDKCTQQHSQLHGLHAHHIH